MRERFLRWTAFCVMLGMVLGLAASVAQADGYIIVENPGTWAIMADQKAIIAHRDGREELIISVGVNLTPQQTSQELAWIIPVPSRPDVRDTNGRVFRELDLISAPEIVWEEQKSSGLGLGVGSVGDVEKVVVLERRTIGVYDVAVLTGTEAGELLNWLHTEGFQIPEELLPPLQAYIDEGWTFVAMRIASEPSEWELQEAKPIWLSFETEEMVYPMRLTGAYGEPLSLRIYVLADHRYELDGFEVEFAGPAELDPYDQALAVKLRGEWFLTKLFNQAVAPEKMAVDFYPYQAASDTFFRQTEVRTYVSSGMGGSTNLAGMLCPCGGCWLALVALLVVLLVTITLMKRRQKQQVEPSPLAETEIPSSEAEPTEPEQDED